MTKMKKIVSILLLCALLSCAVLPVLVSADGAILWRYDFSSQKENDWIWDEDTTKFFVESGKLEGWAEAVVHQSNFLVDRGAPRRYKECAWEVECAALEDGGRDTEEHSMSIWFADYISPYGDPDYVEGTITYHWGYTFEKKQLWLSVGFDSNGEDYKPADYPEEGPYLSVAVPDSEAPGIDSTGSDTFTLGMRIYGGKAAFYLNDKKYAEIDTFRGAKTCTEVGSPVLLFNGGLHCTFDNLVVSTPDYNLFNESATSDPTPVPAETVTEKVIETKVVHETDEEGNDVTVIVTEEVVRPVANTGTSTTGGTATKTGDIAITVAIVMALSLGAAIVVKKVTSK